MVSPTIDPFNPWGIYEQKSKAQKQNKKLKKKLVK